PLGLRPPGARYPQHQVAWFCAAQWPTFTPPLTNTPDAPSSNARFHWWIIVGWIPKRLANSDTVSSPFNASRATFALNSGECCLRFDISDLHCRRPADNNL